MQYTKNKKNWRLARKSRLVNSCFILLLFLVSFNLKAQVFWNESFNNGCSANCGASGYVGPFGPWTVASTGVEGTEPNTWYISCAENGHTPGICGTGCFPASATATLASLHIGADPSFIGDIGAAYDAGGLCGILTCPQTDRRAESPVISTIGKTGITLSFNYIANGDPGNDFGTVMYSINSGATWLLLTTPPATALSSCSPQGEWTAFSIALPATCDNIATLKIGFRWVNNDDGVGTDPSFAVDEVTLSVPSVNSISTGNITGSPFCACSAVNVPFTSTGTYLAGNIYTAQLSNSVGSFAAPIAIGTLASVANAGVIAATIPCGTPTGAGYRIRVVSSSPAVIGSDNGVNLIINAAVVPSVTITAVPSGPICAGTSVTFTATPTNGGTTPTYQWEINGINVGGATSVTFTSSTLVNGDVVSVVMTSNAICPTPSSVVSNTITMTVTPILPASVSITSTGSIICVGDPVIFTANPTNGGATPTYQWQINGTNVGGATSSTFTSSSLANGDVIAVIMTSSLTCVSGSPATSNTITITVAAAVPASVSIAVSPGSSICVGDLATFTATPTNGGATPTYQWQLNGTNIGGATSSTFSSSTLVTGDVITVIMTSSLSCATGSPATSNTITMTVSATVTASVSIVGAPITICVGDPVTFTATPTNGGTPTYQWQVNGVNAGTNSATFSTTALSNGDVVTVIMTSSLPCATGSPATSNTVTITVNTCTPPVANFSANQTIFCSTPACVNFTDLSTNSPTSWSWSFPGATVTTSTSQNPTNICYTANSSYSVTLIATNADGSDTLTQVAYINVGAPVTVTVSGNLLISACESTTLYASPSDGTYVWDAGISSTGPEATVSPTTTTTYTVTYTSPSGCTDTETATVVVDNIFTYYMPTGFSPNGDGINDLLQVHGRGIDYINLKIFDRIGEKVFETTSPDVGWDGKLIGLRMNDNVFVYDLVVTFCDGSEAKEHGAIMLAR